MKRLHKKTVLGLSLVLLFGIAVVGCGGGGGASDKSATGANNGTLSGSGK